MNFATESWQTQILVWLIRMASFLVHPDAAPTGRESIPVELSDVRLVDEGAGYLRTTRGSSTIEQRHSIAAHPLVGRSCMRFKIKTWLLLLSITALAAGIRTYRLADFPPGLHFDEAFHQLEAIGILRGYHPLYFTENMGMDPMHIYMIACLFRLVGVTAIGGRIVSAIVGTLTIPATWWLARELFADWEPQPRMALCAAASFVLATLQWHVTFSRTGIQPSLVPLVLLLTMACLWRGLRVGHWGWFAGAGVCLGMGPYAYSSARVVPLLIIGIAAWLLLFERDTLRRRWLGLLLCVLVSVVVFAPLGIYFVTHWEWFTFRAGQVTFYTLGEGSSDPLWILWRNAVKTLAAFNVRGDVELIRNLPGRPALDPYQSILFLLGGVVCVWRIRRPAYATLLGWIGVMSLPTILTEYAPHFGRALGVTPAVALLVALGGTTAWQGIDRFCTWRWSQKPVVQKATTIILTLGLVASATGHGYAYFGRWGSLPELYQPYDVGLLAATREVRARVPDAEVYLSPISVGHPIPRFVLWDRPGARSYDGRYALVLPPRLDRPADYVIVPSIDDRSLPRLQAAFPDGEIVASGGYQDGVPYYHVYRVLPYSERHMLPQHEIVATWNEEIGLIGYDTDKEQYQPGDTVALTLYWQSLAPVDTAFTVFTHLLGTIRPGTDSPMWAGWDQEPGRASFPTSAWKPGEVIVDEYQLPIPVDAPPGEYQIEIGLYDRRTMVRLPVMDDAGGAASDHAILGAVRVIAQ